MSLTMTLSVCTPTSVVGLACHTVPVIPCTWLNTIALPSTVEASASCTFAHAAATAAPTYMNAAWLPLRRGCTPLFRRLSDEVLRASLFGGALRLLSDDVLRWRAPGVSGLAGDLDLGLPGLTAFALAAFRTPTCL